MQFMIITKAASPPPPQMLLPLNDAMVASLAAGHTVAERMMEQMGGQS